MFSRDKDKLKRAGYRIFRKSENDLMIKEYMNCSGTKIHSKHLSKKSLNYTMIELMKDERNIED
jgi:hypothetical protein